MFSLVLIRQKQLNTGQTHGKLIDGNDVRLAQEFVAGELLIESLEEQVVGRSSHLQFKDFVPEDKRTCVCSLFCGVSLLVIFKAQKWIESDLFNIFFIKKLGFGLVF